MTEGKPDQGLLDSVEVVLREVIAGLKDKPSNRLGRPRVLPALVLWAGMLVCVARGLSSAQELWRILTKTGVWDFGRFPVTDEAVYKNLKKASGETFHKIFDEVTRVLAMRRASKPTSTAVLAPFAAGVYALDEMTLDAVKKRLPSLRKTVGAVLLGKVTALFDLRAQVWHHLEFQGEAKQNEKVAAREMIKHVPKGSLILADLGYFAFTWFDELTSAGYYWLSRLRAKTSFTILHTLYLDGKVLDAIVWLGAYRADCAGHAVRLVSFTRNNKTWMYITNVLDPTMLSIAQIAQLYARRWDIEMMFNMVKTHLNLHVLWSSHINVVLHQVYAVFTVAQVILGLRAEIAQQANADVFEISLDLLIRWLPRFAKEGQDPVKMMVELGRDMKIIRPSTRLIIHAPNPSLADYTPLPSDTILTRKARYAKKT